MASPRPFPGTGVLIERAPDVLTFTLNNPSHENEVNGAMFDAMLAELRSEAVHPVARVLRIRARGKVFCSGRERAERCALIVDLVAEHPQVPGEQTALLAALEAQHGRRLSGGVGVEGAGIRH